MKQHTNRRETRAIFMSYVLSVFSVMSWTLQTPKSKDGIYQTRVTTVKKIKNTKRRGAFLLNFEMWSNTVLSVWHRKKRRNKTGVNISAH